MLKESTILSFLKENKDFFQREFHISKLGLFGSYARGDADEESDIDILIDFDDEADIFEAKLMIKELIQRQFNREADICREKYLKPYVRDEILREAIYV